MSYRLESHRHHGKIKIIHANNGNKQTQDSQKSRLFVIILFVENLLLVIYDSI